MQNIRFSGMNAATSAFDASDGSLDLAYNLAATHGPALSHIKEPERTHALRPDDKPLLLHTLPDTSRNLLFHRPGKGLMWFPFLFEQDKSADAKCCLETDSVTDIAVVGNTLAVATADGLYYILWKGDRYIDLGTRPPFIPIEFGLTKVGTLDSVRRYNGVRDTLIPNISGAKVDDGNTEVIGNPVDDGAQLLHLTQQVYAHLHAEVARTVTAGAYFCQPFFVRYAYRLFDGSYCWHSDPILMLPTVMPPLIRVQGNVVSDDGKSLRSFDCKLDVPYMRLDSRIQHIDALDIISDWADIIDGIDIFISAPIYTYDQSRSLDKYPDVPVATFLRHAIPEVAVGESRGRYNTATGESPRYFAGSYRESDKASFQDHFYTPAPADSSKEKLCWDIRRHDNFIDNLKSCAAFYLVASLDMARLGENNTEWAPVEIEPGDLAAIHTRPRLPDHYLSHCDRIPLSLFAYNSRLNIGGLDLRLGEPLPPAASLYTAAASANPTFIRVHTRRNGIEAVVCASYDRKRSLYAENFPRYIFYPDSAACRIEIWEQGKDTAYVVDLTPHPTLNGAYFLAPPTDRHWLAAKSVSASALPPFVPCRDVVHMRNRVYTSDAQNPFIFPVTSIAAVGSGSIIALRAAVRALSQGQFGQHPLYAFATDGVWAMTVSGTGTFASVHPVSRDVALAPESIAQLDTTVVFATARGIVQLGGADSHSISDSIDTEHPFNPDTLPGLAQFAPAFRIRPLRQFLRNAQIAYDYTGRRLIVFNSAYAYAYIFNADTSTWSVCDSSFFRVINAYPETLVSLRDGHIVRIDSANLADSVQRGLIVTRPVDFGDSVSLKTVRDIVLRGDITPDSAAIILYGSRDLNTWHPVWSSRTARLSGFSGSPYRYFRIAVPATLAASQSISGALVNVLPRKPSHTDI